MQQFGQSNLTQKRQRLIRDIQNLQRQNIKGRARSQMLSYLTNEELDQMILHTSRSISQQQLATLVKYANEQFPKAIAHIGNLLLDDVIRISHLQKFNLNPGFHPYWFWLMQVMVQKEYCTLSYVQHCIKAISPKRSQKTVRHALSILFKITSSNLHSPVLLRDEERLLPIFNACFRQDTSSQLAYLLILELLKKSNQGFTDRFVDGSLRENMIKILLQGSLNSNNVTKRLCCRILNELMIKGIYFNQLNQTVLMLMKQSISINAADKMLDYLTQFVKQAKRQHIMEIIQLGLIREMKEWKIQFQFNEDFENYSKLIVLARQFDQKIGCSDLLSKGVHRQLIRFQLLGYSNKLQLC